MEHGRWRAPPSPLTERVGQCPRWGVGGVRTLNDVAGILMPFSFRKLGHYQRKLGDSEMLPKIYGCL